MTAHAIISEALATASAIHINGTAMCHNYKPLWPGPKRTTYQFEKYKFSALYIIIIIINL